MKIRSQTCSKYLHEEDQKEANRQNEDAFFVFDKSDKVDKNNQNLKIALSDGAGGMGLFAADWSNQLVNNLPQNPFKNVEELSNWIESFWEQFYDKFSQTAKDLGSDYQNKFSKEGSAATLVGLWKNSTSFDWITYGDSCLSIFSKNKETENNFQMFPYNKPTDFLNYPFLINVQEECVKEGFLSGNFDTQKDKIDFIILSSDALSLYILMKVWQFEKPKEFLELTKQTNKIAELANKINELEKPISTTDFLESLWDKLGTKENFEKWCYEKYQNGVLESDDYTCVLVIL
jgi:hypothetical protein